MIPAGYMAKRVETPVGFHADGVLDVYSVSNCVNEDFADSAAHCGIKYPQLLQKIITLGLSYTSTQHLLAA